MGTFHGSVTLRNDGVDSSTGVADLNAGVTIPVKVEVSSTGGDAVLLDLDDNAIANPITTDSKGNYAFKTADGTYNIIENPGPYQTILYKVPISAGAGGGGGSGSSAIETIQLTSGQVLVQFTVNTEGASFYINGTGADNGRILESVNYSYNQSLNQVTLTNSYPSGTYISAIRDTGYINGDIISNRVPFSARDLDEAVNETNTKIAKEDNLIYLEERTIGNGGGALWKYVDASTVTPNTFDVVQCVGVPTLAVALIETALGVSTSQCGFVDDFSVNSQDSTNAALNNFNKVIFSKGTYRPIVISQSNKVIEFDSDVVFKLPDNTSSPTETTPFSSLEVTGNNIILNGTAYIDGNSSNNSSAMTDLSNRKGSFSMQGNNNTWNGDIIILDAYYVGYSIGSDDSLVCNRFTHSGLAKNVSSVDYAFAMWSCLDCHIDTVLSTDTTQALSHRIRTGTQASSTKECKNLTINTIKGASMVGVFETKTVNMQVGKINLAAWKCEETTDFQVGSAISDGCSVDATGFGLNDVEGFQADSILVKNFIGAGGTDFASFIKGKRIAIGSICVDKNSAARADLLIQTLEDASIGRVILSNPQGNSKGFVLDTDPSFTPQQRIEIGSIISSGHVGVDVEFQDYRLLDATVGYINNSATVNAELDGVKGKGVSETGLYNATLTPQSSGSIALNQSTLAYTRTGRVVQVQGRIRVSSISSPTGAVYLSLPYTVENLTSEADHSAVLVYGQSLSSSTDGTYTGTTIQGTTSASLSIPASDFQTNSILVFQISFVTAD